ncbi:NADP-dependent phosphogluconate dehydrogenase [soil metagenome]
MPPRHIGLTGLATMGQNLARNIARHDFPIAVHNRTTAKTELLLDEHGDEGDFVGSEDAAGFVAALDRPRSIIVMVKAGAPVDAVLGHLVPLLDEGDLVIDGGNSSFRDTERRVAELAGQGLRYLGMGVSGGEEGALHGPSLMPGGSRAAYEQVEDVLTAIAATVDGVPCSTYVGDGGAGHYVKMVHNGIEYADMQLIAEAYDLLHTGLELGDRELADLFATWDEGDLDSFLVEITARILRVPDDIDDGAEAGGDGLLLDAVLDRAEQKGTGRLTAQDALELGVPVTAITEAVFARALSSQKQDRELASTVLPGPAGRIAAEDRNGFVDAVRDALYASKVVAYSQGFAQLRRAGAEHGWDLDLGGLATIWRGGCIIRARFLDRIAEAYAQQPDLRELVLAPYFTEALARTSAPWRRVAAAAVGAGIPTPAFSSSLAWYDG